MSFRPGVLLAAFVLLIGACSSGGSDGREKADYTPIPDDELFSQVAALPGVERSARQVVGCSPPRGDVQLAEASRNRPSARQAGQVSPSDGATRSIRYAFTAAVTQSVLG